MKNKIVFMVGMLTSLISFGQDTKQTVTISNLESEKGDLYIGWYNQSSTFRINDKAISSEKIVLINLNEISVDFNIIPKGKYAIAVFLDENDNYELDKMYKAFRKKNMDFQIMFYLHLNPLPLKNLCLN